MTIGATNLDLIYESLRKQSPQTLAELEENTSVSAQNISTALSRAINEGQPVLRVSRGVYAYRSDHAKSVWEIKVTEEEIAPLVESPTEDDDDTAKPTTPKESGRIRRVRQRMKDLEASLDELGWYMTKLEAKARAYDKIQYAVNGVIQDPM